MAFQATCPHCLTNYCLRDEAPSGVEVVCDRCRRPFRLERDRRPNAPEAADGNSHSGQLDASQITASTLLLLLVIGMGLFVWWSREQRAQAAADRTPSTFHAPRAREGSRLAPAPPPTPIPVEEELGLPTPGSQPPNVMIGEPLRVIIDASKDGGSWWSPQVGSFSPALPHQGRELAQQLRDESWQVDELPRGERITEQTLAGARVLIRMPPFYAYDETEARAYLQAVESGATLILLGNAGGPVDPVARIFGLKFGQRNAIGDVERWTQHPLSQCFSRLTGPWTTIVRMPTNAIELAWLEQGPTEEMRPVLGVLTVGRGMVLFTGARFVKSLNGGDYLRRVIHTIEERSVEQLARASDGPELTRQASTGLQSPRLLVPQPRATLPQPEDGAWEFAWGDVPGADHYEIVVLGPTASRPMVNRTVQEPRFTRSQSNGYIVDRNRRGIVWRVRAVRQGVPGEWSESRTFDVASRSR